MMWAGPFPSRVEAREMIIHQNCIDRVDALQFFSRGEDDPESDRGNEEVLLVTIIN